MFYQLKPTWDINIVGVDEPIIEVIHPCSVDDKFHIAKSQYFEPLPNDTKAPSLILDPKSNLLDLINLPSAPGLSSRLLVSKKLKDLIEEHNDKNLDYVPVKLFQRNEMVNGYFLIHPSYLCTDYLDPEKSKAGIFSAIFRLGDIEINSIQEFNEKGDFYWQNGYAGKKIAYVKWDTVFLKKTAHFLIINKIHKNGLYHVSQQFKDSCEKEGITGINFEESSVMV